MEKKKKDNKSNPKDLNEFVNKRIDDCKSAFENGNLGALLDTLYYCGEYNKPLPEWTTLALLDFVKQYLTGTLPKKPGRHAKWIKQYKADMIDLERAFNVQDCIEHGIKWDDVYGAVQEILKGTIYAGSEDAIEKSYKRFIRRNKQNPFRYQILKMVRPHDSGIPLTAERTKSWEYIESLRRKKQG